MHKLSNKKYVLIIPDGAGDLYLDPEGKSPFALAHIPYIDQIARFGTCGRMQTLFSSLPRGSLVAQLGMLGWNPFQYYPQGRASAEVLATHGISLDEKDIAFRANFVRMDGSLLTSYNADYIKSDRAAPLVEKINADLKAQFPEFELYHNSDFRNTLIVRGANVSAKQLICLEPHENIGCQFDMAKLIGGKDSQGKLFAERINKYLLQVTNLLHFEAANAIFPWSASEAFQLPSFSENTGFTDKVGVIGAMDFLRGIAIAGSMDFFPVGTGCPNTNFQAKANQVIELLKNDYGLIICHINATDEASHMGNLDLKISSLEAIDQFIVQPIVRYFHEYLYELGGVMVVPDHYTNVFSHQNGGKRVNAHSLDPVPFAIWNGIDNDSVEEFTEESMVQGRYGKEPISSLSLIELLTGKSNRNLPTIINSVHDEEIEYAI